MAIVPFPNLPPQGPQGGMAWELRTISALNRSPLNAVATTYERAGAHWAARMSYGNAASERRAQLQTLAARLNGHANRVFVPVYGWTLRGSFPATELISNPYFSSTTGWQTAGTGSPTPTLTAADGVVRSTWNGGAAGSTDMVRLSAAVAVTQYAPYALRFLTGVGNFGSQQLLARFRDGGTTTALASSALATPGGLQTLAYTPEATTIIPAHNGTISGLVAGQFVPYYYASLARCAIVDNGQNLLLQSDAIDNGSWTKIASSATGNTIAAPDATTTADSLIESATGPTTHYASQIVTVASAAADFTMSACLRAGTRTFAFIQMSEGTHNVYVVVNLSTGALGTATSSGANFVYPRAYVTDLGGGWYRVSLVARKASSSTSITCNVGLGTGISTLTYTGDGASLAYVWRVALAQATVPTRMVATTTTATTTAGTAQTGAALHLRGLPASTNGLLLQGDPAEIIIGTTSQLVRTRASLNSNAAGLGYWEFEPALRVSPSEGAAVIICNPHCKMMSERPDNGWAGRMGGFSDLDLALVEDTYPT